MRRVFLFILTNLAILVVLGIVYGVLSTVFGLDQWMTREGLNIAPLFVFAAVFGFGGALISLQISRWTAKRLTRAQVIEQPSGDMERWLIDTVRRQADVAGLPMPEVAVFPSPAPNAFATGPSKRRSLVAVSTGLLQQMPRDQVEAVIGHELSHVKNGDMVTLCLIQGVLNTFVIALARIIAYAVGKRSDSEGVNRMAYWTALIAAEIVLGILASIIVLWFSRQREFRADAGGAKLAGRGSMIGALETLGRGTQSQLPDAMAAFGIQGKKAADWKRWFMSHPPIEARIRALQRAG